MYLRSFMALLCFASLCTLNSCQSTKQNLSTFKGPLLDKIFSDNLIIQRDKPIKFWGWSDPLAPIDIRFDEKNYKAKTDKSGYWCITLDSKKKAGPYNLSVKSNTKLLEVKNIRVGDVWLCAGQSNMSWPMHKTLNYEKALSDCCFDMSYLKIVRSTSEELTQSITPFKNEKSWQLLGAHNIKNMSGVSYYFSKEMHALENIPIGIINASYPDSRIEPWLYDSESLYGNPTDKGYNTPSCIYNQMIFPLHQLPIKGIIWYQGESNNLNSDDSFNYRYKLENLIQSYRKLWGDLSLPFVIIQLPNYESIPKDGNANWAILRESQILLEDLEAVNTISTIAIGDSEDLHPTDKKSVGTFAAKSAHSILQNKENVFSGPLYKGYQLEKDSLYMDFANLGSGFKNKPSKSNENSKVEFEAILKNGEIKIVVGQIKNSRVLICCEDFSSIQTIRYAWKNDPKDLTLFNADGYPASSFRFNLN